MANVPAPTRPSTERETEILTNRLETLKADFDQHPEDAIALLSVGESRRNEDLVSAEHAAYAVVCSLILNLDETLTRP